MTVMGDALMERLSDAGSIPARSILEAKGNAWYAGVSLFVLLIQCSRKWRLFDRYFKKRGPLKSTHDFCDTLSHFSGDGGIRTLVPAIKPIN